MLDRINPHRLGPRLSEETTMTQDTKARRDALASFLGVSPVEVRTSKTEGSKRFLFDQSTWLVLTDGEADTLAREAILRDVWTFSRSFLRVHISSVFLPTLEAFEPLRERACERANPVLLTMLRDLDAFVADAIRDDGRGRFLAAQDRAECSA